jgi:hypothetical protein
LSKWSKAENLYRKNFKNRFKTTRTILSAKPFCKNQGGGVKTAVGSELSLVSGTYHENFGSVVMEMASFSLKIRHVFGDTSLTERGIGAGPPVIIQLSGIFLKNYRVTMTTTLDTSCSENTMVLSARRGFLHACIF